VISWIVVAAKDFLRKGQAPMKALIVTTVIVLASLGVAEAQPRRATGSLTPADILRVANVNDAQISPNGQWVVYTVSTVAGDETVSTLWLARLLTIVSNYSTALGATAARPSPGSWPDERSGPIPLLASGWNASNPRWAPDSSKLAFLSDRDEQQGLWVVNLDRREPRFIAPIQNTNFFITYAGESLAWSPDSKRVAYISATEEATPEVFAPAIRAPVNDPRVIDRIQYKSRTSFSDNRRTHVWITATDKPEPRQLTTGLYNDHAIAFSPEGNEIAFLSNHEPDPDANNNSDIFAVDLGGQVRQITATRGCEYEPSWSPDGKWLVYTATKRDVTTIDSVAEDTHVWVVQADGSNRNEISAALDRRARSPRWSGDGKWIYFLANDRGVTRIQRIDVSRGSVSGTEGSGFPSLTPPLVKDSGGNYLAMSWPGPFQVSSFSLSSNSQNGPLTFFAFTLSDSLHPTEIWAGIFGREETVHRVSGHNLAIARASALSSPEELWFKSFDGTRVQGWLIKPVGWREDRKYPLILSIHGGPHGMAGWAFNPAFQVYAARGYAVLYLNPRGSSGYGQKFSDGTLNEWGGGDFRDLMLGVDEALRKYPWIDRERLGVTGASYGGFMTNWIITQTPRFKAAVSVASVSNLISFYSTSLYQDLIHAEFGGYPWDNFELLWQWSPLRYVRQAQTPTLFIHGEQDNDVHITQAEEMYTALKRRGVESVLVRYPREGHGLREPRHRVDALERTLAWFDRFLK
jgi:dipeptidyl aminopeptidase/acylaminoacyl peptidase